MERQIAEMKIQEDGLKRRIALLTAEGEMEKAKAVDELYETWYPGRVETGLHR